jgi:hypothetical protein
MSASLVSKNESARLLLRSTIVGVFAAIALGVLAFALVPFFDASGV